MNQILLDKIEQEVLQLKNEEQEKFLHDLPRLLKISLDDLFLLKVAKGAFEFWNNSEDAIYDNL